MATTKTKTNHTAHIAHNVCKTLAKQIEEAKDPDERAKLEVLYEINSGIKSTAYSLESNLLKAIERLEDALSDLREHRVSSLNTCGLLQGVEEQVMSDLGKLVGLYEARDYAERI